MPKKVLKSEAPLDVVVLGAHPAAYLAAALLAHARLRTLHATIPGEQFDDSRLVVVNPRLFDLHPMLGSLRRRLDLSPVYGVQFLDDDSTRRSEFRSKSVIAYVTTFRSVRVAIIQVAKDEGVELQTPKHLHVSRIDEHGADVTIGKNNARATAIVVGGDLPAAQQKLLGFPESWGSDVVHRYTYVKLASQKSLDLGARPLMPMALNLREQLCWGWVLPGTRAAQLAVEQPIDASNQIGPRDLLLHWADVLRRHGVLAAKTELALDDIQSIDLPLAGALAHEGVANRTLLIGPAGGFYSACSEDIYPNCWSAIFAADALKRALKERHLQDALAPFRRTWRTTLGEYLRGPQQNLRFLLPLVYRNQVMATRLAESILTGKSVVR